MGSTTRRLLHPKLNPTGLTAAAGAVYAAAAMIYSAYKHGGVISLPVIIAAIGAVAALLTRQVVTPVADPLDGAGRPLVPVPEVPVPPVPAPAAAGTGNVRVAPPQPAGPPQILAVDDPQGPFLPHPGDDTQLLPIEHPHEPFPPGERIPGETPPTA